MAAADYVSVVQELYVSYFGRPADVDGLANYTAALDTLGVPATLAGIEAAFRAGDATIVSLVNSFDASTEATNLYGSGTTESFVFAIYQNVLNRVPDAEGFAFWVNAINNGDLSRSLAALSIMEGAQANTTAQGLLDAALVNTRIQVATNFTTAITTENATFAGDAAAASARSMLATVTADTDVTAFQTTIVSTLATITDPNAGGSTFTLTTAATDVISGTSKNDTITATSATDDATDIITDGSTTDTDTMNWTVTGNTPALTLVNVENVNVTSQMAGALTVDGTNFTGVKHLTVARDDLAGGQIDGSGAVTINPIKGAGLTVTAGAQVTALTVTQATTAGATVNATGVTGNVTVTGAATVAADDSTTTVAVNALNVTAQDALATTIDAAKAATVTTAAGLTGAVTVNAAAATTVTVNNAAGGATVNAATSHATAATVKVLGIDSSGATVVVGSGSTTNAMTVELGGTTASTDAADLTADGAVALDIGKTVGAIDNLTLRGGSAAVTYTVTATNGGITTITGAGSNAVNVSTTADLLDGKTVTGVNDLTISAAATGATLDLSNVSAANIALAADNGNDVITVGAGAKITVTAATQTGGLSVLADASGQALTLVAGDNTTTTAQSTTTVNAVDLNDTIDFSTVALVADDSRFTTGGAAFDAGSAAVTITGDQNVTFGNTTAASVDASAFTGVLTLVATAVTTVSSGSGADVLTLNNADVLTVNAGDGANQVTVTNVAAGSTILTGAGADILNLNSAAGNGAFVVQGGAGNDTYNLQADADVVIADSAGTADSLVISNGVTDLTDNDNFAFSGIDAMTISAANAAVSMDFDDLSGKTIAVTSDGATDILKAVGLDTSADTIDFSAITITGGGILQIDGGDKADVMTGSNSGTTFLVSAGDVDSGEVITGGTGTDIISYNGAAALDLTVATVTGIETIYTNGQDLTLQQGTGVTALAVNATTALGTNAGALILSKLTTSFKAAAEAAAGDVNVAGEWFLTDDANADATAGDNALTYFDEVTGAAVTITLTGAAATNVATGSSVLGNLVIDLA